MKQMANGSNFGIKLQRGGTNIILMPHPIDLVHGGLEFVGNNKTKDIVLNRLYDLECDYKDDLEWGISQTSEFIPRLLDFDEMKLLLIDMNYF